MFARLITGSALVTLVALTTFGGCESEVDYSDPEEAGDAVGDAYCGFLAGCCDESKLPGGSEADCVDFISSNFDYLIQQSETDGYEYDPRCAEQQVRLLESASCDSGNFGIPEGTACEAVCAGLAHGSKQKGEACEDPRDCDFGLVCAGTCTDPCGGGVGEPCGQLSDENYAFCEAGLVCALDVETGVGTCASLPGLGDDCSMNFQCDTGLTCLAGICEAPLANGEPCLQYSGCASNYCDTTDPQNPVCAAPPGIGDPCVSICSANAYCDGMVCVELPGEGEPCPTYQCKPDLYCGAEDVCESLGGGSEFDICEFF